MWVSGVTCLVRPWGLGDLGKGRGGLEGRRDGLGKLGEIRGEGV